MLVKTNYVHGSDGCVNLFWDSERVCGMNTGCFVIQWNGEAGFDSGYTESRFENLLDAGAFFIKNFGDSHVIN